MAPVKGSDGRVTQLAVEAYGVRFLLIASDRDLLARMAALAPPGATPCSRAHAARFALLRDGAVGYRIISPAGDESTSVDLELALGILDTAIESYLATNAGGFVFVHAGAVAHRGRAIVIPGPSFSGKTTLVRALVEAGAVYYSDEYAALDERGLVHAYARPLAIRGRDLIAVGHPVGTLGGSAGETPVPVGVIARAQYRPGAQWQPQRQSAARAVLVLLENALPARGGHQQMLTAVRHAAAHAEVLEGERGDATATAAELMTAAETAS